MPLEAIPAHQHQEREEAQQAREELEMMRGNQQAQGQGRQDHEQWPCHPPFDRERVYESMPYQNEVLIVTLTGAELIENLTCCGPLVVAGVTAEWQDGSWQVTLADGTPVQPAEEYQVVTHEWWIAREAVVPWQEKVAAATWLGVDWREPVIDYLVSLSSSPSAPLDEHIDPAPRIIGNPAFVALESTSPVASAQVWGRDGNW